MSSLHINDVIEIKAYLVKILPLITKEHMGFLMDRITETRKVILSSKVNEKSLISTQNSSNSNPVQQREQVGTANLCNDARANDTKKYDLINLIYAVNEQITSNSLIGLIKQKE